MARRPRSDRPDLNDRNQNQTPERDPTHLSATDEDHANLALAEARSSPNKAPFDVLTPDGFKPFYPSEPEIPDSDERPVPEPLPTPPEPPQTAAHDPEPRPSDQTAPEFPATLHPEVAQRERDEWLRTLTEHVRTPEQWAEIFNPKGGPSGHLPQQATPLLSRTDGNADPSLSDPSVTPQAPYVPYPGFTDNVANPRGTPDYLITGATPDYDAAGAGVPSTATEPAVGTPHFDNPKNPRGIQSNLTTGMPDIQAYDAQKAQNPTPARPPYAATLFPEAFAERVSAGQNRVPPTEVIP